MNNHTSTYKLLGQLTLSLAILSGCLFAHAEDVKQNSKKLVKGPKGVLQGTPGRDSGEVIPYTDDLPNGRLDAYEQILKELNPTGTPIRTSELINNIQDAEN